MPRRGLGRGLCGGLLLLAAGCSGIEHKETDELWKESDQHFDSGRYNEAIPYYDELLRRDGHATEARVRRGRSHEFTGNVGGAFDDYAKVSHDGDVRGALFATDLHIRRGDLAKAEEELARLKNMNLRGQDRVAHLVLLGTLRLEQGQNEFAAQSFERALEEGGNLGGSARRHLQDARKNAAAAYYRLRDFGRAYDHMQAYVENASTLSGRDYYDVGLYAYLAGDFAASDQYLAQADPALVAKAQETLDDPAFGASAGGAEPKEWNE